MADISGRLVLFNGSVSYTEEGPRLNIIHSIRIVFVSRVRTPRYNDRHIWAVCVIAPFPNNPNPAEDFDPTRDVDISGQGLM